MRCCATCRGHRLPRLRRSRFPANGAAPRGGRRSSIMGLAGRDGFAGDAVNPSVEAWPRLARVRCPARTARPGLGVLPNPPEACLGPMPRTPPQTHPARPRTVSVRVHHGKEREDQKRIASLRSLGAEHGSALQGQCRTKQKGRGERRVLFVFHQFVSNPMLFPTVTGKLSGVGRCGLAGPLAPWARGMPRAGWAGRPTPVLPCAQDSAHEQGAIEPPGVRALCLRSTASQAPERTAASGWAGPRSGVHGVSCQPTPPHPTSGNPEPLWLWLWLSAVDVARRRRTTARQRGASTSNPIGQLTPVPPMPQ